MSETFSLGVLTLCPVSVCLWLGRPELGSTKDLDPVAWFKHNRLLPWSSWWRRFVNQSPLTGAVALTQVVTLCYSLGFSRSAQSLLACRGHRVQSLIAEEVQRWLMLPQVEARWFHVLFDVPGSSSLSGFGLVMCLLTIAVYFKGYHDFQRHKGVSAGLYKYLLKATINVTFFPLTAQIWSRSIVVRYEHNIYIKFNMSYRMLETA